MAAKRGGGRIKTVVYLDVLLLTNFLTAYLLLLAAGALSGQRAPFARMLAGSALAALSALILFAPEQPYPVQVAYKAATALGITAAAFGWRSRRRLVTAACWYAALNIALDPVLIFALNMGVRGAALATVLSQVASAVLTLRCIVGSQGMPWHIRAEKLRLHGDVFAAICTIGVPAAAQSAMYNISNMFIQSSMNSFGTSTIAAWGVYGKIDFVFWMTINSLGIAITTFAGQNFGARQYDRVRNGVRVCMAMAAGVTLVISVVFYNAAEPLFRLFSQDDAVVAVGVGMMHVLTPVYITYISIEVLSGALRGCGDVRVPTLITVFFVCGLRVLWLTLMVPRYHTIATVELSYPLTWTLASLLFILYYKRGGWLNRCKAAKGLE